jgi:hypothetical protein
MSEFPPIVGIAGLAGCGKDTLAGQLVTRLGYVRYSLADPIKWELNSMFGWSMQDWDRREWKEGHRRGGKSPREWAQWLGGFARTIDETWWIDALMQRAFDEGNIARLVIPDVRYNNEALEIKKQGGVVLKVIRPGTKPVAHHESEFGISPAYVHETPDNLGTPEDLGNDAIAHLRAWQTALHVFRVGT